MSGLPLILLGQWDALWSRVILACGWAFLIWGIAMYLWSAVLYLIQVTLVVRQLPRRSGGQSTQARLHRSDPGSGSSG
jgi:cardiolipin synthase